MPYQQPIISYLEKQLPLLQQRPVVYQHGDFHVGNFIYLPTRQVGVIDFNRWDFGDPYEEFYKLQFFQEMFRHCLLMVNYKVILWESSYLILAVSKALYFSRRTLFFSLGTELW